MNKKIIVNILKKYKDNFNIKDFVLFGSFSNGTNSKDSDIDIAYILKDNYKLSFDNFLKLEEQLSQNLKIKIDLMNFKKLNPLIKLNAKEDFIYI